MSLLHQEFSAEARRILEFWITRCVDKEHGGFYGRIDGNDELHPRADKGVILNTRILWSFAAAGHILGEQEYQQMADRAYNYLLKHFLDESEGGLYWMLDYRGLATQTKKQIYAQAFGIYALTEYHLLTSHPPALELAIDLFNLIEKYSYDPIRGGYLEAFSRQWELLEDLRLSEKDANEKKTMNTHLHVLEAYTNLYRLWPDNTLRQRLTELTGLFLDRIIEPKTHHLRLFFGDDWTLKSQLTSFGHDIEAAWLLTETAAVLGEPEMLTSVKAAAIKIADTTLAEGMDVDGGLWNETEPPEYFDTNKHWWPQAEAMVGFFNAYQLTTAPQYYEAAVRCWNFIKKFIIDYQNGEWRWGVTGNGIPMISEDKIGPWKAPYHNTRACLEMMRRVG